MKHSLMAVLKTRLAELPIQPVTCSLVQALLWQRPVLGVCRIDFGIATADHRRALRALLHQALDAAGAAEDEQAWAQLRQRIVELDAAAGKGPALTALVKTYVPQYAYVAFHTVWDALDLPATETR